MDGNVARRNADGNIDYYDAKVKTVYYPTEISDTEMVNLAKSVGEVFYNRNYARALREVLCK